MNAESFCRNQATPGGVTIANEACAQDQPQTHNLDTVFALQPRILAMGLNTTRLTAESPTQTHGTPRSMGHAKGLHTAVVRAPLQVSVVLAVLHTATRAQ